MLASSQPGFSFLTFDFQLSTVDLFHFQIRDTIITPK